MSDDTKKIITFGIISLISVSSYLIFENKDKIKSFFSSGGDNSFSSEEYSNGGITNQVGVEETPAVENQDNEDVATIFDTQNDKQSVLSSSNSTQKNLIFGSAEIRDSAGKLVGVEEMTSNGGISREATVLEKALNTAIINVPKTSSAGTSTKLSNPTSKISTATKNLVNVIRTNPVNSLIKLVSKKK